MIEYFTFKGKVSILTENGLEKPKKDANKRGRYRAPSNAVLLIVEEGVVKLVVGKDVSEKTLSMIPGFALKLQRRLVLVECELIRKNLYQVDKLVELYNEMNPEFDGTQTPNIPNDLTNQFDF